MLFAYVGCFTTLAYLGIYSLCRLALPPLAANALATLTSIVLNYTGNSILTFRGSFAAGTRHFGAYLIVFAGTLLASSASLTLLFAVVPEVEQWQEQAAAVLANVSFTLVRYRLVRRFIIDASATPLQRGPGQAAVLRPTAPDQSDVG